MILRSNIQVLRINNSMYKINGKIDNSIAKLSSGLRVRTAKDDSAALAVGMKMRSRINTLEATNRITADYISEIDIAEGTLSSMQDIMLRIKELSIQASNGIYSSLDRELMFKESKVLETTLIEMRASLRPIIGKLLGANYITNVGGSRAIEKPSNLKAIKVTGNTVTLGWEAPTSGDAVKEYIIYKDGGEYTRTSKTEFKITGLNLNMIYGFRVVAVGYDGSLSKSVSTNIRTSKIPDVIGDEGVGDILDPDNPGKIEDSMNNLIDMRVKLGAIRRRLESELANSTTEHENMLAAQSRIMDLNYVQEYATYQKEVIRANVVNSIVEEVQNNRKAIVNKIIDA